MNWLNVLQKNQDETCEKLCLCVKLVEYNSKYSVACLFNEVKQCRPRLTTKEERARSLGCVPCYKDVRVACASLAGEYTLPAYFEHKLGKSHNPTVEICIKNCFPPSNVPRCDRCKGVATKP